MRGVCNKEHFLCVKNKRGHHYLRIIILIQAEYVCKVTRRRDIVRVWVNAGHSSGPSPLIQHRLAAPGGGKWSVKPWTTQADMSHTGPHTIVIFFVQSFLLFSFSSDTTHLCHRRFTRALRLLSSKWGWGRDPARHGNMLHTARKTVVCVWWGVIKAFLPTECMYVQKPKTYYYKHNNNMYFTIRYTVLKFTYKGRQELHHYDT